MEERAARSGFTNRPGAVRVLRAALLLLGGGSFGEGLEAAGFREEPLDLSAVELEVIGPGSEAFLWRKAGLAEAAEDGPELDGEDLVRRLREIPAVESVDVETAAGKGIRMRVIVREPLAFLICPAAGIGTLPGERAMVVDRFGVAIPASSYENSAVDVARLPFLHALKVEPFQPGVVLPSRAIQTGVALLERRRKEGGLPAVRRLKQLNDYSILVDFEGGPRVQFPFDNLGIQLQRLRLLMSYAEDEDRRIERVNLVPKRNVAVTFAEESREQNPGSGVKP